MKKITGILLVLLVAVVGFAGVTYSYAGEGTYYDFTPVASGDTIEVSNYIYLDGFTYVSGTPDAVFMSFTEVSTTAAATTAVNMSELEDVKISVDHTAGSLTFYFNNTSSVGVPITADWEIALNTKYFNRFYIKNTATTTTYSVLVERVLE